MISSTALAHAHEPVASGSSPSSREINAQAAALALRLAPVADEDFLSAYALAAYESTGADIFMIGRLNPYSNLMRSVRLVREGRFLEPVTYSLDGTPCARAADTGACIYRSGVAGTFPKDAMLAELGVEGYAGAPLHAHDGQVLGVVVAMTASPIENDGAIRQVLDCYRGRVAAAIEAAERAERRDWAIAEATNGVWDWDLTTGGAVVTDNLQALLGDSARGTLDLSKIEAAIHPDDKARHTTALHDHLKNNAPYDLRLRLRDAAGAYRWYHSRGKALRNAGGKPLRMIGCFSDIHELIAGR
ncbi:PAS domain-containing protein [Hyphococcus sp.]|uniref:PAS domain-containing protein n=1 Tax=Hyphococcus sp. TaxID=2038636 RepID=UPI003CCB923D